MAKISDVEIPSLLFDEQAGDPSTPASGFGRLYVKSDGVYFIDDAANVTGPFVESAGGGVGNLWTMANGGSSQSLSSGTEQTITFDTAEIDGGGSVIDLANDRFVAPATGFYLAFMRWMWEGTQPGAWTMGVEVGGANVGTFVRSAATAIANGAAHGSAALSLTNGDFVTMAVNPGSATPTSRGNASSHLRSSFTLVRIT